jgi:hypothetical protein
MIEPDIAGHSGRFVSDLRQVGGFPVSFTNKTDRHDKTEILLKVALTTISLNQPINGIVIVKEIMY